MRWARPPTIDEPVGIDVEQDEFVHRQASRATGESLDEFGRIGAAATDDGDLQTHAGLHGA